MARYLHGSGAGNGAAPAAMAPNQPAISLPSAVDGRVLAQIGLTDLDALPADPRLLLERLKADDAADALVDAEEFTRGIRRAVRLGLAFRAKLHRASGQRWTEWISAHFQAGYSCYQRYHIAAEIQLGLLSRGLPVLGNENQARALAPFRKHEKFWEAVGVSFKDGFPVGRELRQHLQHALGVTAKPAVSTPRIKLHRLLKRVIEATPASDDRSVAQALDLVQQAVALLETGGAT